MPHRPVVVTRMQKWLYVYVYVIGNVCTHVCSLLSFICPLLTFHFSRRDSCSAASFRRSELGVHDVDRFDLLAKPPTHFFIFVHTNTQKQDDTNTRECAHTTPTHANQHLFSILFGHHAIRVNQTPPFHQLHLLHLPPTRPLHSLPPLPIFFSSSNFALCSKFVGVNYPSLKVLSEVWAHAVGARACCHIYCCEWNVELV